MLAVRGIDESRTVATTPYLSSVSPTAVIPGHRTLI